MLRIWNPEGKTEIIDVGFGWYIVRFNLQKDCLHVLVDGPWKLFDQYVVAQRWRPNFDPANAKVERMAVWVRLSGLPVEFFREKAIREVLNNVGTPLKIDTMTVGVDRGRFARAVVEIDLTKSLVAVVMVQDRLQKVEFEGMHVICFGCGEVGHRSADCNKHHKGDNASSETGIDGHDNMQESMNMEQAKPPPPIEKHGAWMMVNYKNKNKPKPPTKGKQKQPLEGNSQKQSKERLPQRQSKERVPQRHSKEGNIRHGHSGTGHFQFGSTSNTGFGGNLSSLPSTLSGRDGFTPGEGGAPTSPSLLGSQ
ncbi:PREDICTED: uncharacterized protein LOC109192732 [Ipomoea nil]|uniref:uncharacterized protein LOC109192732 n=1 Tax=Ipomoea nil TaxID=35883 RepID=UPI0009014C8A|nr:PREDICTED: uncharacterized protein LOC109192732 [Ipomoea nil]